MIELLIVITIAGILAAVAAPSFRDVLRNMRMNSATGLVMSDLNMARGEAIKRNGRVLICVRNSEGTDCGTSTNWHDGWLVCPEGLVAERCVAATNPLAVRPPLDASLTLNASAAFIRFNANSSQGVGGVPATVTLSGNWTDAPTRTVTVAGTGSISRN